MENSIESRPHEPWLAVPSWKDGCIRPEERRIAYWAGYWVFAFVLIAIPLSISKQWGITTELCWLGGILSVLFIVNLLRDAKHHAAQLKLRTIPGVIGGSLAADFVTNQQYAENTIFEATLLCDHYIRGEDDSPGKRESLWSDTIQTCSRRDSQAAYSTWVPIRFAIPLNCQVSSLDPATDGYYKDVRWKLSVRPKAVLSRTASFVVPVFRTSGSRPTHEIESEPERTPLPALDIQSELEAHGIKEVTDCQTQTRWEFRRRQPRTILQASGFIALIIAAIVLMAVYMPREALGLVAFLALLPAISAAVILCTLIGDLLWICRIVRHEQSLEVLYGWKGFRKTTLLPRDHSTFLSRMRSAQLEVGELWELYLNHPTLPQRILLLKRIESNRNAIELQQELARQLGIRVEDT